MTKKILTGLLRIIWSIIDSAFGFFLLWFVLKPDEMGIPMFLGAFPTVEKPKEGPGLKSKWPLCTVKKYKKEEPADTDGIGIFTSDNMPLAADLKTMFTIENAKKFCAKSHPKRQLLEELANNTIVAAATMPLIGKDTLALALPDEIGKRTEDFCKESGIRLTRIRLEGLNIPDTIKEANAQKEAMKQIAEGKRTVLWEIINFVDEMMEKYPTADPEYFGHLGASIVANASTFPPTGEGKGKGKRGRIIDGALFQAGKGMVPAKLPEQVVTHKLDIADLSEIPSSGQGEYVEGYFYTEDDGSRILFKDGKKWPVKKTKDGQEYAEVNGRKFRKKRKQ